MSTMAGAPFTDWNGEPEVLEEIARVSGFAFYTLDEDDRVAYWGVSAQDVLGVDPHAVIGRQCLRGIPGLSGLDRCPVHAAMAESEPVLARRDGTTRRFRRFAFPRFEGPHYRGSVEVLVPTDSDGTTSEPEFTRDAAFAAILAEARKTVAIGLPIHLDGEAGTEKVEVIRWLYPEAPIRTPPVGVDAAGLAQMFDDPGSGVVFIEQVEDLPVPAQRVLRALVQRRCDRAEAGDPPARLALVTSSASPQLAQVTRDLAVLLATLQVPIPPLRRRPEDVEPSVYAVLKRFRSGPRQVREVEPAALDALKRHAWPGNMDELRLVVLRAALRGDGATLRRDDLPEAVTKAATRRRPSADAEMEKIRKALEQADGSVALAADALGISRSTLWRQRRRHGL